jgi:hypothetical protein
MKPKAMLVAQTPQRCMNGRLGMIYCHFSFKHRLHSHRLKNGQALQRLPWRDISTLDS